MQVEKEGIYHNYILGNISKIGFDFSKPKSQKYTIANNVQTADAQLSPVNNSWILLYRHILTSLCFVTHRNGFIFIIARWFAPVFSSSN